MKYFAHETAVIDAPCTIEQDVKIWHFCHVMAYAHIGKGSSLGQNVFVAAHVRIGAHNKIQNNVSLYEGVVTEDEVFIGPSVVFTNVLNPRASISRKDEYMPTLVKKGATIGANATIVCGNTIGNNAFVGAGAVVTKEVPDHALVVGNPGKQIGWMSRHGERLHFENGEAQCPVSKEKYVLRHDKCLIIEE